MNSEFFTPTFYVVFVSVIGTFLRLYTLCSFCSICMAVTVLSSALLLQHFLLCDGLKFDLLQTQAKCKLGDRSRGGRMRKKTEGEQTVESVRQRGREMTFLYMDFKVFIWFLYFDRADTVLFNILLHSSTKAAFRLPQFKWQCCCKCGYNVCSIH